MLESKVTPIIAVTALLVAVLGATPLGHAASRLVLPKNSVGSAQIKRGVVSGKKIAKNAVTSAKVKNGSLMAADFKAGQLPPGPQGPKGDTGAAGAPGISGYQIVNGPVVALAPNQGGNSVATCPAGKKVLGGGYSATVLLDTQASSPLNGDTAWIAAGRNVDGYSGSMVAYVICANVS